MTPSRHALSIATAAYAARTPSGIGALGAYGIGRRGPCGILGKEARRWPIGGDWVGASSRSSHILPCLLLCAGEVAMQCKFLVVTAMWAALMASPSLAQ